MPSVCTSTAGSEPIRGEPLVTSSLWSLVRERPSCWLSSSVAELSAESSEDVDARAALLAEPWMSSTGIRRKTHKRRAPMNARRAKVRS